MNCLSHGMHRTATLGDQEMRLIDSVRTKQSENAQRNLESREMILFQPFQIFIYIFLISAPLALGALSRDIMDIVTENNRIYSPGSTL